MPDFLVPDWPAPAAVRALQTLRAGGCSAPPWDSLNLGDHVGDDVLHVAANRALLRAFLPDEPFWLKQVHGTVVVDAGLVSGSPEADAVVCRKPGKVCAVMTADCLPVLFCDRAGTVVAAAHAGWRGLLAGVLEATLQEMAVAPGEVVAWLGPAIGPQAFEVGDDVRSAFVAHDSLAGKAFHPQGCGKWLADIYQLARQRLGAAGVVDISGGNRCTAGEESAFFSYRRDGVTGRMASLVWLENRAGSAC